MKVPAIVPEVSVIKRSRVEEALYLDDADPKVVRKLATIQAQSFLDDIKGQLRSVYEMTCFFDVVFVLPKGNTGLSRGFIAAATKTGMREYRDFVRDLVDANLDVAGHPTFRAGLPLRKNAVPCSGKSQFPTPKEILSPGWANIDELSLVETRFLRYDLSLTNPDGQLTETDEGNIARSFFTTAWEVRRKNAEQQYGGEDRSIDKNFEGYCDRLAKLRNKIVDVRGRNLRHIAAVPLSYWISSPTGRARLIPGGSFFVGTCEKLDDPDVRRLSKLVAEMVGAGYLVRTGKQQQQVSFAHQSSAVIDTIVQSVERLPENVQDGIGADLIAKFHLLRALINSYRSKASRVDSGPFPFDWGEENRNPLSVYCDIGIQLGLARCQDAPAREGDVALYGYRALRPENQLGKPGFEKYRELFDKIPVVSERNRDLLKHSSFAILILLVLKQAVYHTVRSRELKKNDVACIKIGIREVDHSVAIEITIINPSVTDDDNSKESKDVEELQDLADRLSDLPSHRYKYDVVGPLYNAKDNCWTTSTRIEPSSIV